MPNALDLARIADDTYAPKDKSALLGRFIIADYLEDENFLIRFYKPVRGQHAVIAIRGTANWRDVVYADLGAIGLSLNALALKINSAIDFVGSVKGLYRDCWLTGHSLGGAYVQLLAAIFDMPGMTFNAPGVLGLLNQMSSNWGVKLAGSVGGGAFSALTLKFSDMLNMAASAFNDAAFPPIMNWRGNMDPVSVIGAHVGAPLQTVQLIDQSPHPHSMSPIIRTWERQTLLAA